MKRSLTLLVMIPLIFSCSIDSHTDTRNLINGHIESAEQSCNLVPTISEPRIGTHPIALTRDYQSYWENARMNVGEDNYIGFEFSDAEPQSVQLTVTWVENTEVSHTKTFTANEIQTDGSLAWIKYEPELSGVWNAEIFPINSSGIAGEAVGFDFEVSGNNFPTAPVIANLRISPEETDMLSSGYQTIELNSIAPFIGWDIKNSDIKKFVIKRESSSGKKYEAQYASVFLSKVGDAVYADYLFTMPDTYKVSVYVVNSNGEKSNTLEMNVDVKL